MGIDKIKRCRRCSENKELTLFYKHKKKGTYSSSCKECRLKIAKEWNKKNKQRHVQHQTTWRENNRSLDNLRSRESKIKNKEKDKEIKKLRKNLRCRVKRLLKYKRTSTVIGNLGCSVSELKRHLESKFLPGMTWDNWSIRGWHIDHIVPLSSAGTKEELIKLCHYTNLQPLWWKDNISKGSQVE
jgi:hypothetical protein